ncbi:MAG: single-stranded DNA-binding protein [Candidatus Omnitrophica bacterium]|nr:single-stranded DNA-binding protein [Candidatus Omnitrophota bacterium]
MPNLNKVFLIGNLTRDPELRYVPSGTAVATFGLAINRVFTTQGGERKEETCFVRVVVWGKQAESCSQYLAKGSLVFVEGRLVYRAWESEGQRRTSLEVRADRVQFLDRSKMSSTQAPEGERDEHVAVIHEEDIISDTPSPTDEEVPF